MHLAISLLIAYLLGWTGAWFISRYAYRFGLIDIPNDRSSHSLPTPRGGGIGILAAFIVSSLYLQLQLLIWLPAAVLALVSFFDDKLDLSPQIRLSIQFVAAFAITSFWILSCHSSSLFTPLLVLFFSFVIVGTANFYNFMDGINGIAGITGVVSFVLLGFYAHMYAHQLPLALSAYCMAAACLGFLPFNIPNAKVFMGDVGSILLGFIFAAYIVILSDKIAVFLLLAGFLSTFYADAITTLWIRKRDGESLSQAHRRHLYQLFANQKKVAHWYVSAIYGLIQTAMGIILLLVYPLGWPALISSELAFGISWYLVMLHVRKHVEGVAS